MGLNSVIISGNVASDIELNGIKATFRLAVQRQYKENGVRKADFVTVACWVEQAEFAVKHISKGDLVEVRGVIRQKEFERYEIKAEQIELMRKGERK